MLQRTISVVLLSAFLLVCTVSFFVNSADANPIVPLHLPTITINEEGSVTPETSYIIRTGNTYTLTADLRQQYSIVISCDDIIFDGGGHLVNVTVDGVFDDNGYPAAYVDVGVNLMQVNNVVVKNVQIFSSNHNSPNLQFSNHCQIVNVTTNQAIRILGEGNKISNCNAGIIMSTGGANQITRNNINYVFIAENCSSNVFFENNFYLDTPEIMPDATASWDNGSVGNYWCNYSINYPDAHEIENTGLSDTPYVISSNNVDHYPILNELALPTSLNSQNQSTIPELTTISLAMACITVPLIIIKMKTKTAKLGKE